MQRIGFIGIGLMGRHMALHLLKAGHPLTVWNRTESKAQELLSAGAAWADSPKAVARDSDVLITMVTDSAASEEVICGSNGVLDGAREGMVLIDMGSIAPEMSRSIAERARAKGVSMLDAPVTGAPKVAAARSHSEDMGLQNYFSHTSLDGRTVSDRITDAGSGSSGGGGGGGGCFIGTLGENFKWWWF